MSNKEYKKLQQHYQNLLHAWVTTPLNTERYNDVDREFKKVREALNAETARRNNMKPFKPGISGNVEICGYTEAHTWSISGKIIA